MASWPQQTSTKGGDLPEYLTLDQFMKFVVVYQNVGALKNVWFLSKIFD